MAIKTLFKSINEIQEYITVDIGSNERTILPYIKQAEKYTTNIIGKALHSNLLKVVHDGNDEEKLKELLNYVRLPLANYGYMLAVSKLNVNVGEKGFTVTENQNLAPASKWRVDEFRESVALSGADGLEDLLEYLEANAKHFPKWVNSTAYSFNKQFFINNASEFNASIKTTISRLEFLKMREFIHQIEQSEISKAICSRLFDKIKSEISKNKISDKNFLLLDNYIRPAICYLALNKLNENENYLLEGVRYIKELREFLNDNANDYKDYKLSNCFDDPAIDIEDINNEESGMYIFGTN